MFVFSLGFFVKSKSNLFSFFQEEIRQSLDDHYKVYQKRIETFPRLPCPTKTHQARLIQQIKSISFRRTKFS